MQPRGSFPLSGSLEQYIFVAYFIAHIVACCTGRFITLDNSILQPSFPYPLPLSTGMAVLSDLPDEVIDAIILLTLPCPLEEVSFLEEPHSGFTHSPGPFCSGTLALPIVIS